MGWGRVEIERIGFGSVGSDRCRAVGCCRGKGEAEDRSVGSDRWVLPWKKNDRIGEGMSGIVKGSLGLAVEKK